jgi:hypothetical protein
MDRNKQQQTKVDMDRNNQQEQTGVQPKTVSSGPAVGIGISDSKSESIESNVDQPSTPVASNTPDSTCKRDPPHV